MATTTPRGSFFNRKHSPQPFRITERDKLALRKVARFRLLSSRQIARTLSGSDSHINRRIRQLFHHGYLDCPPVQHNQLAHVFEVGNFPLVYGLSSKGAQLIAPTEPWIDPSLKWSTNNQRVGAPFIAHTLAVADFLFDLEDDCARATPAFTFIDHYYLLPSFPEEHRHRTRSHNPFALRPVIELSRTKSRKAQTIRLGVVPDRLFSLARTERMNFAYERDQGHMDVGYADERTPLVGRASIKRKIVGYWHAWQQQLHTTQWNFKSFRVLFDTTNETRLKNMLELQTKLTGGGSNLFLFTSPERLNAHGPLGKAWITGKGDEIALVPASLK